MEQELWALVRRLSYFTPYDLNISAEEPVLQTHQELLNTQSTSLIIQIQDGTVRKDNETNYDSLYQYNKVDIEQLDFSEVEKLLKCNLGFWDGKCFFNVKGDNQGALDASSIFKAFYVHADMRPGEDHSSWNWAEPADSARAPHMPNVSPYIKQQYEEYIRAWKKARNLYLALLMFAFKLREGVNNAYPEVVPFYIIHFKDSPYNLRLYVPPVGGKPGIILSLKKDSNDAINPSVKIVEQSGQTTVTKVDKLSSYFNGPFDQEAKIVNYMCNSDALWRQSGGASKQYVRYNGKRYLVKKHMRKNCIHVNGAPVFLSDIKGQYAKCGIKQR